jgi:hypothetical protein
METRPSLSQRLLRCYYPHVETLRDWLARHHTPAANFICEDDRASYRLLLHCTLVASTQATPVDTAGPSSLGPVKADLLEVGPAQTSLACLEKLF